MVVAIKDRLKYMRNYNGKKNKVTEEKEKEEETSKEKPTPKSTIPKHLLSLQLGLKMKQLSLDISSFSKLNKGKPIPINK